MGILTLVNETGWWKSALLEDGKYKLCTQGVIEDERHFVFNCEIYPLEWEALLPGNTNKTFN